METEKSKQEKRYPGVGYQNEKRDQGDNRQEKSDNPRMQDKQSCEKGTAKGNDNDGCVCDPCECEPCTCDSKPNEHMEGIDTNYGQCSCQQKEVVVMEDDDRGTNSRK